MLCIKTGLIFEKEVAENFVKDAFILTGFHSADDLDRAIPKSCTRILSFGLCGGLQDIVSVGRGYISALLLTPEGAYRPNLDWGEKLYNATNSRPVIWFSNGELNTADSPEQKALFGQFASCIDDESYHVAQFAKRRNIPFQILRTCSDAYDDDVSFTKGMMRKDGGFNREAVSEAFEKHPKEMKRLLDYFDHAISELTTDIQQARDFGALNG